MSIKGDWITYADRKGYFAYPENAREPLPAIVVIQEIWGVNEHIEDVSRRFAAAGYAVLAPDLFAVNGERPAALTPIRIHKAMKFIRQASAVWKDSAARKAELAKFAEPDRLEIGETCECMLDCISRQSDYVPQLRQAVRYLRNEHPITKDQKVACVGFCMGGGLSALLACEEPELAGAAVFYGKTPPEERIPCIKCPVIGFYGANDQPINSGIQAFEEGLRITGKPYERTLYEGANHSFFNDDGPSYNVKAVRDSFVQLMTFLLKTLSD